MDVDVITETEIDCPCAVVAAYAANPTNAPHWYRNILQVEWQSPPQVEVGARVAFVASFLGRRLAYTYEIVQHDPGAQLVMRTAQGPFPMETTYGWRATATGGTHMTLRNRGAPHGFAKIAAPLMMAAMRRANRQDLACLKRLLEGDRAAVGSQTAQSADTAPAGGPR